MFVTAPESEEEEEREKEEKKRRRIKDEEDDDWGAGEGLAPCEGGEGFVPCVTLPREERGETRTRVSQTTSSSPTRWASHHITTTLCISGASPS